LYAELGGPAPLRDDNDRKAFEISCKDFTWAQIEPALHPFQKNCDIAKRHWPWVALALGQYRLEREELQRAGAKLNSAEVVELLNNIRRSAKELANGLGRLQEYSNSVADPAAPLRQPHLAYLDEFISQAAAGHLAAQVSEDGEQMLRVHFGKQSFLKRLIDVEVATGEAMKRVHADLLKRRKGQADPGLYNLVWRGAEIWSSLTGRTPSPNKVHRRYGGEPDFVAFIQGIVSLAGGPRPSRKNIEISLRNHRTPDRAEKFR
jgi:hypothetical protein